MNLKTKIVGTIAVAVTSVAAFKYFDENSELSGEGLEKPIANIDLPKPAKLVDYPKESHQKRPVEQQETDQVDQAIDEDYTETSKFDNRREDIILPNGEIVPIAYKSYKPAKSLLRPDTRLVDVIDELEKKAESGDSEAAADLANSKLKCSAAPLSKSEYDQSIFRLETEGISPSFNALNPRQNGVPVPANQRQLVRSMLTEHYSFCEGINSEQLVDYQKWFRLAAMDGNIGAANKLVRILGDGAEAFNVMKVGWDNGHIGNGYALSRFLIMGITAEGSGAPDYVQAYAYSLATNLVWAKAYQINNSPLAAGRIVDMDQALERVIGVHLNPARTLEAQALAAELLRENENCCVGTWERYGLDPSPL